MDQGFNPRARTGRDVNDGYLDERLKVSIHAPARGATYANAEIMSCFSFNPRARTGRDAGLFRLLGIAEVSIHAPARGATWTMLMSQVDYVFQSTRPHGARRHLTPLIQPPQIVSIHAPARGATLSRTSCSAIFKFQSTRPHGARLM